MKRYFLIQLVWCLASLTALAQDKITTVKGDLLEAKVLEVTPDEVRYKKWENLDGPTYSIEKSEVFMIEYENGSKDVFGAGQSASGNSAVQQGPPAQIYFFRPNKFAGSSPEIIVGTVVPDEVIIKVKNGHWCKVDYSHFGVISFVTGVYSVNPEHFDYNIEPGQTYYVRCTLYSKGFSMMSKLEQVDEATAKGEMGHLKEQTK